MSTLRVRRLDAAHDMTFGAGRDSYAATSDATAQRLVCRLWTIRGEWFLDTDAGVPWWPTSDDSGQTIMGNSANLQFVEAELKACILGTDGVATCASFSAELDHDTRKLTVTAEGTTTDGDVWTIRETF